MCDGWSKKGIYLDHTSSALEHCCSRGVNEVAAIIITENAQPDEASIAKANQQGVILLSTSQSTYEINGQLWQLGIRN